ncbi:aldehyde dehydrogenase family protein, partial [Aminobacter sp. J15]|uniref:aldehyde dehydrogenase family protein n=2 Tax=unclassified Aminobacter TaxID=2644704 RepID=UPI0011A7F54D
MLPLKDPGLLSDKCLVNGEWVEARSGKTVDVTNPATGELIARVPSLSAEEVEEAISQAAAAFRPWAKRPAKERSAILRKWFDLMVEHADDLAVILTSE